MRPFLLIQEDLRRIFEHIEPSDVNSECYSFRLYEIIIRSCIEIEANFKAILSENNYGSSPRQRWSMLDYKNLEPTHLLTGYRIQVPFWEGVGGVRSPFSSWAANEGLLWYKAYNSVKHDRHEQIKRATLSNAVDAVSALLCVLSAQFYNYDFQPGPDFLYGGGSENGFEHAIGGYFLVSFPDWPTSDQYDFAWHAIRGEAQPFRTLW